jgi:hypothetical protein
MEQQSEKRRFVELKLKQARSEASFAQRRYAASDPNNRLIAAQLEKCWEATLVSVQECEAGLATTQKPSPAPPKCHVEIASTARAYAHLGTSSSVMTESGVR